jgi:hypothetical protein
VPTSQLAARRVSTEIIAATGIARSTQCVSTGMEQITAKTGDQTLSWQVAGLVCMLLSTNTDARDDGSTHQRYGSGKCKGQQFSGKVMQSGSKFLEGWRQTFWFSAILRLLLRSRPATVPRFIVATLIRIAV